MSNISVIIRNRNEERYIGYAIQSVLDTFNKPEIIVVDNNSTDNSMGIVNMFKRDNTGAVCGIGLYLKYTSVMNKIYMTSNL